MNGRARRGSAEARSAHRSDGERSWHPASQDLFADIDRQLWHKFEGDPLKLLGAVSVSRLEELATDESFLARMHGLAADLDHYLTDPRWYQHQVTIGAKLPQAIAYFSMEFGVTEALPNYSGGLGILAGDHLKSASDLGVPIIGVGPAVDITLLARFYERYADHAVSVARRVVYVVTGRMPGPLAV